MTIFDNYVSECRKFFCHFFGDGGNGSNNKTLLMFVTSPSCWNVHSLHLQCTLNLQATQNLLRGYNIVVGKDSKLWQWKIMVEELKEKD